MTESWIRASALPLALLVLFGAPRVPLSAPPDDGGQRPAVATTIPAAAAGSGETPRSDAPDQSHFWARIPQAPAAVIVVLGAPGASRYGSEFHRTAALWADAAERSRLPCMVLQPVANSRERLKRLLERLATADAAEQRRAQAAGGEPRIPEPSRALWLVLIGHGTFDGRSAKFNLAGPDVSAAELAQWLQPQRRTAVVVCGFSCSGAFLPELSAAGRVIVTATKSGNEHLFSRFGHFFAQAVTTSEGDLDKDGRTSVWEAFLAAARRTEQYYRDRGQLATEHALLDDNGDGRGVRSDWFDGLHPHTSIRAAQPLDGLTAHQIHLLTVEDRCAELTAEQRSQRQRLETELRALRARKEQMSEAEYLDALESVFLRLAELYEAASPGQASR